MKKKLPSWIAICAACFIAAAIVLAGNRLIADRIQRQSAEALNAAIAPAMPQAASFEALDVRDGRYDLDAAYAARDAAGATVGYVGKATVTGYGGPVEVTTGVGLDGAITGVIVGGEGFAETQGLGALTRERAFTDQFVGKTPQIALGEDGVDTVSGASTTSRAVVSGVNRVANYFYTGELGLAEEAAQAYTGQTASASRQGYGGQVTATVGLDEGGAIEYLSIETPDETDGLGKRCSEPEFTKQFLGKTGPFAYGEDGVEAVTGATVTSTAVLEAINEVVPAGDKPASEADVSRYMRPRPSI